MQREEKVNLEKSRKIAEDLAKNNTIKVARGDIKMLEFHTSISQYNAYESVRELSFMDREMEMLEFRKKMETDQEVKESYDKERSKPLPKPQYWNIPVILNSNKIRLRENQ